MDQEHLVERSRAIALEVERDIAKTQRLDRERDRLGHLWVERLRQLRGLDLDPRELTVVPQANLCEAEVTQALLTKLHLLETVLGDLRPVGQAR